ncbi:MAG: GNAT family N-acetyltransferase [Bryobacterales bacterium]|nr:GNAT family N-acetyltransferase [Bryobacterales bacterium]
MRFAPIEGECRHSIPPCLPEPKERNLTTQFVFSNLALARRLEEAEALAGVATAEAGGGQVMHLAGAHAVFMGDGSPLTQVVGLGLNGPVTAQDLDQVEEFFRSRGATINLHACPLADPTLFELVGERCYKTVEFNNVLVRALSPEFAPPPPPPGVEVRIAKESDMTVWANLLARSFFEHGAITAEEIEIGMKLFQTTDSPCYLALLDGQPAAGASMGWRDDLAILYGDGTPPEFRGRGAHMALIYARLADAVSKGSRMATASTLPGSISQRNYERTGFRVVYTKALMQKK